MVRQSALHYNEAPRFTGFTIGKVTNVYPQSNMVDVSLFDGSVLKEVQIIVSYASSKGGTVGLSIPILKDDDYRKKNPLSAARQDESDVFAIVGFLDGSVSRPLVFGFLFPEDCELLCGRDSKGNEDGSMFLWKHESNVYVRVAKGYPADNGEDRDGEGGTQETPDIEISHPSGCLIKIGNVDYSKGFDEQRTPIVNWDSKNEIRTFQPLNPVTKKVDPAPSILITHPSGTSVNIMPSGETRIYSALNLGIEVGGDMTEEVTGDLTRTYHGNVTEVIEGTLDQTVTGKVTHTFEDDLETIISGDVTEDIDGSLDKTIGNGVTESITGDVSKTISGDETDSVTGAWDRSSDVSINDSAPSVEHN